MRIWLPAVAVVAGCNPGLHPAIDAGPTTDAALDGVPLTLLQANVGNLDADCLSYKANLCTIRVEERAAERLRTLDPDLVVLQELVSVAQCDELDETNPRKVCHPEHIAEIPAQVSRLLGADYSIACDDRNGYECVGVHRRAGAIAGCEVGTLCEATALPAGDGCDPGFTISATSLEITGFGELIVVNGHPPSGPAVECRADQLRRVFSGEAGDTRAPMLLAGDFNLDPFRGDDESVRVWNQHVGPDLGFRYHSGPAEREPPLFTAFSLLGGQSLDHVVSNTAAGTCATLGEAEGTERLDGGDGMDHRALDCRLRLLAP